MELIDVFAERRAIKETGAADLSGRGDRRKRPRTRVHWPLWLHRKEIADGIESTTQNLSSTGFYCLSHTALTPGEAISCTLRIPAYNPKGEQRAILLECAAVVLRAEAAPDGFFGIACRIEDYHLLARVPD